MYRAVKFYWPIIIYSAVLAGLIAYLQSLNEPECVVIMGYSASLWGMILFCFAMPLLVLMASVYLSYAGYHSLKQGVYPPDNVPMAMKVRSGRIAKAQGFFALIFPLFALGIVWLGYYAFDQLVGDGGMAALQQELVSGCQ